MWKNEYTLQPSQGAEQESSKEKEAQQQVVWKINVSFLKVTLRGPFCKCVYAAAQQCFRTCVVVEESTKHVELMVLMKWG